MAKRQLSIIVGREGAVTTDFLHFTGTGCIETGQQLQRLLAEFGLETEVTTFTPKPELFQAPEPQVMEQHEVQQEGGL